MARLSAADLAAARELEASLATIDLRTGAALTWLTRPLREYLAVERVAAYQWAIGDEGVYMQAGHVAGFTQSTAEITRLANEWVGGVAGRWALYDPIAPEPFQRNAVIHVGTWAQLRSRGRGGTIGLDKLKLRPDEERRTLDNLARGEAYHRTSGIADHHQVRVLVCDGPIALAWLGLLHPEEVDDRTMRRFRRIVPALRRRLIAESRIETAPVYRAGLSVALEAIARPAMLVTGMGRILHANTAARAEHDRSPAAFRRRIADALRAAPGYEVLPVHSRGSAPAFIVIAAELHDPPGRATRAGVKFGLTRRQTEVLRGLLEGHSNRRIAHALGCSERTVEVHVTKILRAMNVSSRAALIALLAGP